MNNLMNRVNVMDLTSEEQDFMYEQLLQVRMAKMQNRVEEVVLRLAKLEDKTNLELMKSHMRKKGNKNANIADVLEEKGMLEDAIRVVDKMLAKLGGSEGLPNGNRDSILELREKLRFLLKEYALFCDVNHERAWMDFAFRFKGKYSINFGVNKKTEIMDMLEEMGMLEEAIGVASNMLA